MNIRRILFTILALVLLMTIAIFFIACKENIDNEYLSSGINEDASVNINEEITQEVEPKLCVLEFIVEEDVYCLMMIEESALKTISLPTLDKDYYPDKEGYYFIGWQYDREPDSDEAQLVTNNSLIANLESNNYFFKLYPCWKQDSYSITYTNTLSQHNKNPLSYVIGASDILLCPLLDTEDAHFEGWYYDGNKIDRIDTSIEESISIEARWTPIYSVTQKCIYKNRILEETTEKIVCGEAIKIVTHEIVGYKTNSIYINDKPFALDCEEVKITDNMEIIYEYDILAFDMPIVIIDTFENQEVLDKENYVESKISIINTQDQWIINEISAGLRLRGNSSLEAPKKSFRIKFDKKQSVLGSTYKAKSWTLIANYYDKSMSRNYIAYSISDSFSGIDYTVKHEYVEVFLNGDYIGVYLLCDQVQSGQGRVDINEDYTNEEGDLYDVGYLLELDDRAPIEGVKNVDYFTIDGFNYTIKTPDTESDKYNTDATQYIQSYLINVFSLLEQGDWLQICETIDVDSFVQTYIIQELFANLDVGSSSFFIYKDKGGRLTAGPIWDFDLAAGNTSYIQWQWRGFVMGDVICEYPNVSLYAVCKNPFYEKLMRIDEFKQLVSATLVSAEDMILHVIDFLSFEGQASVYRYIDSFKRNYQRWDIMDVNEWYSPEIMNSLSNIEAQLYSLKIWLIARWYYVKDCYLN